MITVYLLGGLGNQMFQYAVARHLSIIHNTGVYMDISEYRNYPDRHFSLDCFMIKGKLLPEVAISNANFSGIISGLKNRLFKKKIFLEHAFNFDPDVLNQADGIILSGYFQSEKYFKDIKDVIKSEFNLKTPSKSFIEYTGKARKSDSISVHIRRGDYANKSETKKYHGLCTEDYYYSALKLISKRVKKPVVYIFSDDCEWVKKTMHFPYPVEQVSLEYGLSDPEEMILMSNCKYNICANSSFSWWSAWLNRNPGKVVIAPKKWFNNPAINTKDLIPESWIKI